MEPDRALLKVAEQMIPPPELEWPWVVLRRAIDHGSVRRDDLREMIDQFESVPGFTGCVWDEFSIELWFGDEGEIEVALLDEKHYCRKEPLLQQIKALLARI